jgi:hypothetical protein
MMLTLAAAAAWAAMHEPASFDLSSAGQWGLEMLAVALLVRAVLALLTPVLALFGALLLQAVKDIGKDKSAES